MVNNTSNGANLGFEQKLWSSAGKLRVPFEVKS